MTHERRASSNVLSWDTSNFDQKRLVSLLAQAFFSFDGSGMSLDAFGVTVDLKLAQHFKFSSEDIGTDQLIGDFDNAIITIQTS